MEKIEIRKSIIKNCGKKIGKSCNTESNIYLLYNEVVKIINFNLIEQREEIILNFALNNIEHCTEITKMLYENNKFYGFSMIYYDEYKLLSRCLGKINLVNKKIYCHQLIETYKNIKEKLGVLYYDFHSNNIMIKNNDLILLDIDSCIDYNIVNEKLSMEYLLQMVLQIIFDCSLDGIGYGFLSKEKRKQINDILFHNEIFNFEKQNINEIDESIEDINNKKINQIKKQIPNSLLYK